MRQIDIKQLYSNVKDVYVELNNYTFFHSPSGVDKPDSRFIGRKKLINKIKNILNNSETKSGTYLVTGYRGVGKTSLVNKAISEVSSKSLFETIRKLYFNVIIYTVLIWFSFQIEEVSNFLDLQIALFVLLICGFMIAASVLLPWVKRPKGTVIKTKVPIIRLKKWLSLQLKLIIRSNSTVSLQFRKVFYRFSLALLANLVALKVSLIDSKYFFIEALLILFSLLVIVHLLILMIDFDWKKQYFKPLYKAILLILILSVNICLFCSFSSYATLIVYNLAFLLVTYGIFLLGISHYNIYANKSESWSKMLSEDIVTTFSALAAKITNWYNYSKRVTIKINLGHDKLEEIDVLRIIAKRVNEEYNKINSISWRFPFNFKTLKLLLLLSPFWALSLFESSDNQNRFYNKSFIGYFLPSQVKGYDTKSRYEIILQKAFTLSNKEAETGQQHSINKPISFTVNSAAKEVAKITIFIDLQIVKAYQWLGKDKKIPFIDPSDKPNYLFILTLILLWYFLKSLSAIQLFGLVSHTLINRRLKLLDQRISSQVVTESGQSVGSSDEHWWLGFIGRKKRVYPIADVREIESELISIFEDIDKIPRVFGRPEFIFVLDELDKIEAHQNSSLADKESERDNLDSDYDALTASTEMTRRRRQTVAAILANLKHFFNTLRAKFILIAGREMYDAAMADISDRNYFLGSIFNDVIYVNSFLIEVTQKEDSAARNDDNHMSYHHTSTEEFVCQFIIPKHFQPSKSRSLKTVNKYFLEQEGLDPFSSMESCNADKYAKVARIIFTLKAFITYLTYRSSGIPKKTSHLFESYVETCDKNTESNEIQTSIYNGTSTARGSKLYLHFNYHDLYTFGLINYLATPFYYNITLQTRGSNDKIMVATSYLLDHLYKFHNTGFSWRNLEVTPEIIDVNKAPILRTIIQDIVNFLAVSNLEVITSGLYDFKFNSRLAMEITYLSKVAERESAAFNFTLDESQEIKRHYRKKLHNSMKEYRLMAGTEKGLTQKFIYSIGLLQQSIGDLHYYDQEYDDAIAAYQSAIEAVRQNQKEEISMELLIILIRIMLKLGNTLEGKKSYASATMVYANASELIVNNTYVDTSELDEDKNNKGIVEYVKNRVAQIIRNEEKKAHSIDSQKRIDQSPSPYWKSIKDLDSQRLKFSLLLRSTTVDNMRLIFQPFIAKLYAIDKESKGELKWTDIEVAFDEMSFLLNLVIDDHVNVIRAEYYNKIGDLLFFKNKKFSAIDLKNSEKFDTGQSTEFYKKVIDGLLKIEPDKLSKRDIYSKVENKIKEDCSFDELKTLANNLSDLGDALIPPTMDGKNISTSTTANPAGSTQKVPLEEMLGGNKKFTSKIKDADLSPDYSELRASIQYYSASYEVHIKNNDYKRAAFQYLKILHLIVSKCDLKAFTSQKNQLLQIENQLVTPILSAIHKTYSSSSRPEIEKAKSIFKLEQSLKNDFTKFIFTQLPQASEVQEVIALYNFIRVHAVSDDITIQELSPSYYTNMSGMYSRIIMLSVKVRANSKIYGKICKGEKNFSDVLKDNKPVDVNINYFDNTSVEKNGEAIEYLITDSIYCLTEMIRLLQTFGVNYITNHSLYGFTYEKRAEWSARFEAYRQYYKDESEVQGKSPDDIALAKTNYTKIYNIMRELVGAESMIKLKPKYNIDKAKDHYTKCINAHNGKFHYLSMTENMHYLDDDFNDEYLHFYAALERSKLEIIQGKIDDGIVDKIKKIKPHYRDSKLYEVDKYLFS